MSKWLFRGQIGELEAESSWRRNCKQRGNGGSFTQQNDSGMMQEDEQIFAAGCSETQKKYLKSPHSFFFGWKEVVPDLSNVFVECWRKNCSLDCNV